MIDLLQIWVSIVINNDDWNSALDWRICLWYYHEANLIRICHIWTLSISLLFTRCRNESCDDHCTIAKIVESLFDDCVECRVWWDCLNICLIIANLPVHPVDSSGMREIILGKTVESEPKLLLFLSITTLWGCKPFLAPFETTILGWSLITFELFHSNQKPSRNIDPFEKFILEESCWKIWNLSI